MSAVLLDAIERIDKETPVSGTWDNGWDKTWSQSGGNYEKGWNNNSGW